MDSSSELPIAQRRHKRRCSTLSSPVRAQYNAGISKTPRRKAKRVRFSDTDLPNSRSTSTGLTPFVRSASLTTPRKTQYSSPISNFIETHQFTPFRQLLDERCQRRIRRNGMSEELNEYEKDKKTKHELQKEIDEKDAELQRLRQELDKLKSAAPEVVISSSQRVDEVEAELAQLRQSFSKQTLPDDRDVLADWSYVQRGSGPGSEAGDTIQIWEDDVAELPEAATPSRAVIDGETLAMGLELESARNEKNRLFSESRSRVSDSFDMHFADSPARPQSKPAHPLPSIPSNFYQTLSKSLKATTQRAEDAENALAVLEAEVKSLGFDGATAIGMLSDITQQFRTARLDLERTLPGETAVGFVNAKVLPEVIKKLRVIAQMVKDRDAELKSMRDQQKTLRGNFDHAIIASEKVNARVRDLEEAIDEGAEEMLRLRMKNRDMEKDLAEKETSVQSLITALDKYREDVTRLEQLILQLETEQSEKLRETEEQVAADYDEKLSDLAAKATAEETGRRAAEKSAVERLAKINEMGNMVAAAQQHAANVESQLDVVKCQLGTQNTTRDTESGALNTRISNLSTALASANAEVDKLRITKTKLEQRVREETEKANETTEYMSAQLIKAVIKSNDQKNKYLRGTKIRDANWELANEDDSASSVAGPLTPITPSVVRFADVEDDDDHVMGSVKVSRGKGRSRRSRRRYDSGIGMDSLSEDDGGVGVEDSGLMTPEVGSEVDYPMAE